MPIAIISDLDVRALEYYDDNSKDRKNPRYWSKATLQKELEKISKEVNYDQMSSLWSSRSAFESEIRKYKTADFRPVGETINNMKALLTEENMIVLNDDILALLRTEKKARLETNVNYDRIKIFLPNLWTLEYEIACSSLYRLLELAIRAAQKESNEPTLNIDDDILMSLWDEVKTDYPEGHVPTREDAYKIFKPLNDGTISKAITAQFLAGMIAGELPPVSNGIVSRADIKNAFETDVNLKYLTDGIKYVVG